ncbi:hypothetical protein [Yoonia sp. BS5-3]|uniref:Uncharacterized protein n=1 Tax=Yoonia phaeophyticola TaxID=3137369 RepID=A0ABZ2UZL4_9RHOB
MTKSLKLSDLVSKYSNDPFDDDDDLEAFDALKGILASGGDGNILADSEGSEDSESTEDSETTESSEDSENSESTESSENSEAKESTLLDERFEMPPDLIITTPDDLLNLRPSEFIKKVKIRSND